MGLREALFGIVVLAAACSDGVTPAVRTLRFVGQAPDAPLVMILQVGFFDPDGDLAGGEIESFINDKTSGLGQVSLAPYFLFNELDLRTTEATFDYALELNLGDSAKEGAGFDLGVRLTDGQGHVSATKSVHLVIKDDGK